MPDIVLIHGLWMTPRSWERWKERYEGKGHTVHTPAWPGLEVEVEELRRNPAPLENLGVERTAAHLESFVRGLDSPPIIMGHSMGGMLTQLLLDRGLGAAGVGVAPATVKGIPDLPLSTIRVSRPILGNPFSRKKATALSDKQFHYAFANTLSKEESDGINERYAVPAANRVLWEVGLANLTPKAPTKVDFENANRAPMHFISFEHDHVVPPKPVRNNAKKYKAVPVEYREFPGRPHFPGVPGWEEVADYALDWATANAR